jgi:hypothetical protein
MEAMAGLFCVIGASSARARARVEAAAAARMPENFMAVIENESGMGDYNV